MLNIDNLTLGNEWKNDSNDIYKITSNFSEGNKIYIELEKVANVEPSGEIIPE